MKKLLSLLALSTLVGTSASSLKPVFINNVVSHGFKSNQLNNKDISIRGDNDNPFINSIINTPKNILSLSITSDGTIWASSNIGLYKSTDGINFEKISSLSGKEWLQKNKSINTVKSAPNGTIYVGEYQGLYKIDLIDNLLTLNQPNYIGDKYDGFVYKNEQKLDFKEQYLKSAIDNNYDFENQINNLTNQLKKANKVNKQFINLQIKQLKVLNDSHDLKTPIVYLLWYAKSIFEAKNQLQLVNETLAFSNLKFANLNNEQIINCWQKFSFEGYEFSCLSNSIKENFMNKKGFIWSLTNLPNKILPFWLSQLFSVENCNVVVNIYPVTKKMLKNELMKLLTKLKLILPIMQKLKVNVLKVKIMKKHF